MDSSTFEQRQKKRRQRGDNGMNSKSGSFVRSHQSSRRSPSRSLDAQSKESSIDELDQTLEYQDESGLAQFLRIRRETWKIRLGSLKINKRLLRTTFQAWKTYKDPDPKLTKEELEAARIAKLAEIKRYRTMHQVPKIYFGKNSIHQDYIVEPGVTQWQTKLWIDSVPFSPNPLNVLAPVDPLPDQFPLTMEQMYKSAIDEGHATYIRQLLKYREEDPSSFSPLIVSYAMASGWPTVVKVFMDFGIDPDGIACMPYAMSRNLVNKCTMKSTFLHRAAHRGDYEQIRLLLSHGANVNAMNSMQRTPLHLACSTFPTTTYMRIGVRTHPTVLLLEKGANPDIVDAKGMTALHIACLSADTFAIQALVASGASALVEANGCKQPYQLIPKKDLSKVLHAMRGALVQADKEYEYQAMFAKTNARIVFRYVMSSFAVTCKVCGRRLTTCRHNRMTKYAYWKMTHKYSPRDCNIEASARRQNKRDMTQPIPKGFSKPWKGPLYDAPDIERRNLPPGAEIGKSSPAVDLSGNFDSMGNLPWETFLSPEKANKRRKGALSLSIGLKELPWHQLTFAERKVKIKQQVAEKEAERQARKIRQLRGEESSSSSDSSGDSDDDSFAREAKKKSKKSAKGRFDKPRGFTLYDPFAKKAAELNKMASAGEDDQEEEEEIIEQARRARRLRKTRTKNAWEDGEHYTPEEIQKVKTRGDRKTRGTRDFRKSAVGLEYMTEEQRELRAKANWKYFREKLKPASRELLRQQVMLDPTNLQAIVRLGMACCDTGSNATPPLTRLAVLLLDKAILHGYDPSECDGGEGHFWKKYAKAHTVCWECGGGHLPGTEDRGRERLHLERSLQGWEQALHYMGNATNPKCWEECALVSQRLGDYETAANVLGKLIQSFPDNPDSAAISIHASSVLAQLQHYEQAVMYMHHAIITGAPSPLTNLNLMFFMSRLHEKWARSKNPIFDPPPLDALDQADAGYTRCYEFEEERGGVMFRTEWAVGGSKGWINSNTTWRQMGDAATYARQFLLASDLYAEGIRRDPPTPLRSAPYTFISRAYARAGKIDAAIESAETAIEVSNREMKKFKAKAKRRFKEDIAVYENWLDKLSNPKASFNEELQMAPMLMLSKYEPCIPSASTLRQVPAAVIARNKALEMRSKEMARARGRRGKRRGVVRWEALRDKLKGAARRYFQMQLLQNPKNGYSGAMLAQMGILCVDSGPKSTPQMDRCAAIILQKAVDAGYSGDPEVPNSEANFWLNFSRAHYKLWLRDGIRAERIHLKRSSWGWEKALGHVRIACDVGCWREAATVHICLGDYPRAAQILGILVRSFPKYPSTGAVQLDIAMLLFQLQQYGQALAYARAAMATKRLPPPFTHMDLIFFIARIYDELAIVADEDREAARIARRKRRADEKERKLLEGDDEEEENEKDKDDDEDDEDDDEVTKLKKQLKKGESSEDEEENVDSTETEGEDLGGDMREMAEKARMKVLKNFVDSDKVEATTQLEGWLGNPDTYSNFAKRAVDAGKYLIAVDLYRDALRFARQKDTPEGVVESGSDSDAESETSLEVKKRLKKEAKAEKKRQKTVRNQLISQDFRHRLKAEDEMRELTEEEKLELERSKYKRVVGLWFGLAKAHCRCGQMQDAIRACKEALACPTDDDSKFENVLKHWQDLSQGGEEDKERISAFEEEVNSDLPTILDRYVAGEKTMLAIDWDEIDDYNKPKTGDSKLGETETAIVAKYRNIISNDVRHDRTEELKNLHTVEEIETYMVKKRRWGIMREGVKAIARESLRNDILEGFNSMAGKMERDCGDEMLKKIALVGFSCASETGGRNDTVNIAVGGTLLLAKAFDYGWLDVVKKEHALDDDEGEEAKKNAEARLWKARAISHWRVYDKQGCGAGKGEKAHLELSLAAWEKALKHLGVAGNVRSWEYYASAVLAKGDYGVAANAYGTILQSFRIPNKVGIALVCSSLLKALGVYDQAVAYMFTAISMSGAGGGPGNYDSLDLAFLMARLHEEHGWFEQQKKEGEARALRRTMRKSRKTKDFNNTMEDVKTMVEAKSNEGGEGGGQIEEGGVRSVKIARTAYLAVFDQLQQLQEEEGEKEEGGEEEKEAEGGEKKMKKKKKRMKHTNAREWLADSATWLRIADTCSSAGHHIFASDLYEQALKRQRRGKDKKGAAARASIAVKLSKSFRKCGQFERSVGALTMAVNEEPDTVKKSKITSLCKVWKTQNSAGGGGRAQRNTMSVNGIMPFKVAIMLPVSDILKKFVPRPSISQEDPELKRLKAVREMKARNGKWKHLRRSLKQAARVEFAKDYVGELYKLDRNADSRKRDILKGTVTADMKEELAVAGAKGGYASETVNLRTLDDMELRARDEVTVALKMLVTMGKLCHESSAATNGMHRCAATLMQRAVDCGYAGDGVFWRQLAISHFKSYVSSGVAGERAHLELASKAWDKAFEHLDNASKVECWLEASTVRIHMGDFERAAQTLGVLVRSFPKYKGLSAVGLTSASILQKLGNFEQARAYMYDAMNRGAPAPFTHMDLTFYMARLYEQWSDKAGEGVNKEDKSQLKKTASTAYFAVYTNLVQSWSPLVMGPNNVNNSFNVWIESASTWRWFGEKACLGNNFILGGQMYEQGLLRDRTLAGKNLRSILCFGTAKCCARYGNMVGAKKWLLEALEGTDEYAEDGERKDSVQMQMILEAWDNPTSRFQDEMALPIPKLLAGYSLISPSAATTPTGTPRTLRGDDMTPRRSSAPNTPRGMADSLFSTPMSKAEADEVSMRWGRIRRAIVNAAVEKLVGELKVAGGVDIWSLARRIAFMKIKNEPEVAAAILQRLCDVEQFGENVGHFYERLGTAHTQAWFESKGMTGGARLHLILAKRAWEKGLTQLSVASQPMPWAQSVAVNTSMGDFEAGSEQLGTLVRSFPQIEGEALSVVGLSASGLLGELGKYEEALSYLIDSVEKGPAHPFTELDMAFFVARMNERWGGGAAAEEAYVVQSEVLACYSPRALEPVERDGQEEIGGVDDEDSVVTWESDDTRVSVMYDDDNEIVPLPGTKRCELMKIRRGNAKAAYERVFEKLKEMQQMGVQQQRLMNASSYDDYSSWLQDARTWLCYGELANMGSMYLLASDMFGESIKRENASKAIHCHLARSRRMVGDLQGAKEALNNARSIYRGNLEDKVVVKRLKIENKKILALMEVWDLDDRDTDNYEDGKIDEVEGTLKRRLGMGVKDLVLDAVIVREGTDWLREGGEGRGWEEGGDGGEEEEKEEEIEMDIAKRKLNRKVEPWRLERRDNARALLWRWLKAGLKNAARLRIVTRAVDGAVDGAVFGSEDSGCLGILLNKSSRRELGGMLLEKAIEGGWSGYEDKDTVGANGEEKREESDGKGKCSGWMGKNVGKARFSRVVAECWRNLSRAGESRFHSELWLDHAKESLELPENAMNPDCWIVKIQAQLHMGMFEESMESLKGFLKLSAKSDYRSHASVLNVSLMLRKGGESCCSLALEGMRSAMEMESEEGRKCGLMRRELTFLYAFAAKRSADNKIAKELEMPPEEFVKFPGGYDDLSLVLFQGVFQEEENLQRPGSSRGSSSGSKRRLNFVLDKVSNADPHEAVKIWLGEASTWKRFARRCEAAGQVVFCLHLYRHAFNLVNMEKSTAGAKMKVTCARNVIKSMCRLGMFTEADFFLSREVPPSLKDPLREFLRRYSQDAKEKEGAEWKVRKRELGVGAELDGEVDLQIKVLETRPQEMLGKWKMQDAENERRWRVLKKGLRPAARALAIQQVLLNDKDVTQIAMLGLLCTSDNVKSAGTERCACLLMQTAAEMGFDGNAVFWKKLARCHLSLWHGSGHGRGGGGGERGHLVKADIAFSEALKHLENASDIKVWISAAETKLCLGQYSEAAMCLGTLMRQIGGGIMERSLPDMGKVCLTVVELLMELGKFQQAEAYLYDAMVRGAEGVLTNVDLLFYMARLHGKWSETGEGGEAASKQHMENSNAAYANIFRQCVSEGGEGGTIYGIKGDMQSPEEWLSNYAGWCCFAERAALARHYLLAADLYKKGLMSDDAASSSRPQPWFSLAKACRRCGKLDESLASARRAVEIWRERGMSKSAGGDGGGAVGGLSGGQMKIAIKAWEDDEIGGEGFEKEMSMGVAHWIDIYLSSGQDGEFSVEGAQIGGLGGLGTGKVVKSRLNSWQFGASAKDLDYEDGGKMSGIWGRMRRGVVTAALTVDVEELLGLATDRSHNLHEREMARRYARVGLLCASHRHVSVDLARVGARLIEMAIVGKLFEIGQGEVGEGGVVGLGSGRKALMWRRLAECHAVVAEGDGFGREEERWRESRDAWKQALTFLECATDQHCWESNIFVSISLGDYVDACNTLGILLRSFKSRVGVEGSGRSAGEGRGGSYNRLLAASLLMKLGKFEQAHSYIVVILERANETKKVGEEEMERRGHVLPPAPLTHLHLVFIASRCYELWGSRGGGEGTQRAADAGFRRCYGLLLESHDGTVSSVEHKSKMAKLADKAGGAVNRGVGRSENVEEWLGLADTWRHFAMDFHSAGLDLFAGDLLGVAIKKLPKTGGGAGGGEDVSGGGPKGGHVAELAKRNAPLGFWLDSANVAFKSGDVKEAEKLSRVALQNYPYSRRAKKSAKMLEKSGKKGGYDKMGSLKYMRKKGLEELCMLVKESAPLTVLQDKVSGALERGGNGGGEKMASSAGESKRVCFTEA